jgi:DNA polymerase-3 subunit delta'
VHHAYLFDGPDGVGKERAGFGLAQALVCERRPAGEADACGECSACLRAIPRPGEARPLHPDVVVVERGLYDPASLGRRSPETQDISIDQIRRVVLARGAFPPHEGRAKVFVVRRAEELSVAAANALLKTLEEPGARTHFVLLSSVGDALLPTIRSRTLRVRFGALPDEVVASLLAGRGVDAERAGALARLSGGSVATALTLADPEAGARREDFVSRAMAALSAPGLSGALELAEDAKKGDKEALTDQLRAFAARLAAEARGQVTATASASATATTPAVALPHPLRGAEVSATRHALVIAALEQLDANASVQLVVETMFIKMRAA